MPASIKRRPFSWKRTLFSFSTCNCTEFRVKWKQLNIYLFQNLEVRIEAQRPLVHNQRIMRSYEDCGKGDLPKWRDAHFLKAGSGLNKHRIVI